MKILFPVNQTAMILGGYDAPSSVEWVEVVPAELALEERRLLAMMVGGDVDARRYVRVSASGGWEVPHGGCWAANILTSPGMAGVKEALARGLQCLAESEAEKKAENREEAEAFLGAKKERKSFFGEMVEVWPDRCSLAFLEPELKERVEARLVAVKEENRSAIETARTNADAVAVLAASEREAVIKNAAERADREVAEAMAILPQVTADRVRAGYCSPIERAKFIRMGARQIAGIEREKHSYFKSLTVLTDEEFLAFNAAVKWGQDKMPEATVEPVLIAECFNSWRASTSEDMLEDIDEDDKVFVPGKNIRRRMMVSWRFGGMDVSGTLKFEDFV